MLIIISIKKSMDRCAMTRYSAGAREVSILTAAISALRKLDNGLTPPRSKVEAGNTARELAKTPAWPG